MVTTLVGTGSAVATWLVQWVAYIEGALRFTATAAAAGVAVLSFLIKLRTWRARNPPPKVPPDVDDDFPL
jgi:hypothetical protein